MFIETDIYKNGIKLKTNEKHKTIITLADSSEIFTKWLLLMMLGISTVSQHLEIIK